MAARISQCIVVTHASGLTRFNAENPLGAVTALLEANFEAGTVRADLDPESVLRGLGGLVYLDPSGDWQSPAALRCAQLCDAAEGGEIFLSPHTARLLEHVELGDLRLRDLGFRETRRTREQVRAFELVVSSGE